MDAATHRATSADLISNFSHRWTRPELNAAPEIANTVAVLNEAGISHALTSVWYAPRNVITSNDSVAAFVEWKRGRLVGAGSVDISRPIEAMREIRRCIIDVGFKAMRCCRGSGQCRRPLVCFIPFTLHALLGVPFCTKIGQTGPLMSSEVGRSIFLDQLVLDFLDLLVVWERLVIRGQ